VPGSPGRELTSLVPLLAAELNVKRVEFVTTADSLVTLEARPNFRTLGRKFGKETPAAARAVTELTGDSLRAFERGERITVTVGDGDPVVLEPEDLTIVRRASGDLVVQEDGGYFAAIDPTVTDELKGEGLARELVSRIQRMRRDAGLAVSDRVRLALWGDSGVLSAVKVHESWIAQEVLAREVTTGEVEGTYNATATVDLDGHSVGIAITRVENA
jgi:isoleucyl-tRNA synthetase